MRDDNFEPGVVGADNTVTRNAQLNDGRCAIFQTLSPRNAMGCPSIKHVPWSWAAYAGSMLATASSKRGNRDSPVGW